MRLVFAGMPAKTPAGVVRVTLHAALIRASRVGTAAANTSAAAAGRMIWAYEDRVAGYRASGTVLERLGYGHVWEWPR